MSIGKRILALVLVVFIMGMSFSSCVGQFAAFNKSAKFIGNIGGKYIGGIIYWILGSIVSPVALTLDLFIFNVIEFWSGKNIIASGNTLEQVDENGTRMAAVKNDDGTLSVTITEVTGDITEFVLERDGNDINMFDANGVLISSYTTPSDVYAY